MFFLAALINLLPYSIFRKFIFCLITSFSILITLNFLSFFFLPHSLIILTFGYLITVVVLGLIISRQKISTQINLKKVKTWILSIITLTTLIICGTDKRIFEGLYEGHDILHYAKLAKNITHKNDLFFKYRDNSYDFEIKADKHPPLFTTIIGTDFIFAKEPSLISDFRFSKMTILISLILLSIAFPSLLLNNSRIGNL
jgi:hypothetical protein